MSSKDILKRLLGEGWYIHRTKGSHHQLKHPEKPGVITVPHPKKDLPIGTVKSIFKSAGIEL